MHAWHNSNSKFAAITIYSNFVQRGREEHLTIFRLEGIKWYSWGLYPFIFGGPPLGDPNVR